jgi:hypothetical protein
MRPDLLRKLLKEKPFSPFRVYVSDGATYDVAHPEIAWVRGMTLVVNVYPSGFAEPRGERLAHVSLIHVTRVEVYYPGAAPAP